jgi:hypothetical protein
MNFVLSVVTVVFVFLAYRRGKTVIALWIGVAFVMFGFSHFENFIGLSGMANLLFMVRADAYFTIIFAFFKAIKT